MKIIDETLASGDSEIKESNFIRANRNGSEHYFRVVWFMQDYKSYYTLDELGDDSGGLVGFYRTFTTVLDTSNCASSVNELIDQMKKSGFERISKIDVEMKVTGAK